MMESFLALLGALATVAACYALGSVLAARLKIALLRAEKLPLCFLLGAVAMNVLVFAILCLRIAYAPVLMLMLAAAIGACLWTGDWRWPDDPAPSARSRTAPIAGWLFAAITIAYSALYLSDAWAPEISPDGSTYHLGLVARYLRAHALVAVTTNVYASLSEGVEMLFVPAFAIGRHSAAALVHFAFLIALALAVFAYGKRIGKPPAGAAAALLVYLSPVVGVDGTSAYIDVATAAVVFGVFYFTQIWDQSRDRGTLVAAGLLAGYCYAAKYTAAVMAIYAAGFVLWRARRIRPALTVAGLALLIAAPWVIRNWIYWQNPIAPFGNAIFRNPFIYPDFERAWTENLRTYGLASRWMLPLEVTVRGTITAGILGPVFLLAPIALLALRWREGRRLLVPAALLIATYFANVGTRFLIPALPFVALAMALALERAAPILVLLVLLHASLSWPKVTIRYSHAWIVPWFPYREALGLRSREAYLMRRSEYRQARMIERNVPPGERVFAYAEGVPNAYTSRDVLVSYESASNSRLLDIVGVGWAKAYQPGVAWTFSFPERAIRRIRVVQTASMPRADEQWNIHEMRFLDRRVELPRGADWRLRAFPNPWGIEMAFDHSIATRWRSWETAAPGMYVDVDFGRQQPLDQVLLETSTGDLDLKMELQEMDAQGRWIPIAAAFTQTAITVPGSPRREAMRELHLRGVNYLMVRDADWAANSFAAAPESWGLQRIARESDLTLYRVIP